MTCLYFFVSKVSNEVNISWLKSQTEKWLNVSIAGTLALVVHHDANK